MRLWGTLCQFAGLTLVGVLLPGCGGGGSSGGGGVPAGWDTVVPVIVEGYVDRASYAPGDDATLYVNAKKVGKQTLRLYDANAREVHSVSAELSPQQAQTDSPWEKGFGYRPALTLKVPDLPSGFYVWEGKIPFIVKDADHAADVLVVYPTNTENAYNDAGGRSLYTSPRAYAVSVLRPLPRPCSKFCDHFCPWLAKQTRYRVGYVADADLEDYREIDAAKVLVVIGHSEYWTRRARENFDAFVDSGRHALILSGNTMWWQVRYSDDLTQMICYKNWDLDPVADPLLKTVNWGDLLQYPIIPSIGGDFPHGGYGWKPEDRGWDGFKIVTPNSLVFNGTGVQKGDILPLWSTEYDGTLLTGFDSAGYPMLDRQALGFHKAEIIGFDYGSRAGETVGTWIAFRKTETSGTVINAASTDWCAATGIGAPPPAGRRPHDPADHAEHARRAARDGVLVPVTPRSVATSQWHRFPNLWTCRLPPTWRGRHIGLPLRGGRWGAACPTGVRHPCHCVSAEVPPPGGPPRNPAKNQTSRAFRHSDPSPAPSSSTARTLLARLCNQASSGPPPGGLRSQRGETKADEAVSVADWASARPVVTLHEQPFALFVSLPSAACFAQSASATAVCVPTASP